MATRSRILHGRGAEGEKKDGVGRWCRNGNLGCALPLSACFGWSSGPPHPGGAEETARPGSVDVQVQAARHWQTTACGLPDTVIAGPPVHAAPARHPQVNRQDGTGDAPLRPSARGARALWLLSCLFVAVGRPGRERFRFPCKLQATAKAKGTVAHRMRSVAVVACDVEN
ncbi:hypothetical protein CC78DRAFT_580118 [Lojkania enalia]|uniref:Uncharacterized protein n=1 Tax=Lojkania enalia TaxID=147567 RepID=A0A9P4KBG1_9PLEO|nr:hypothetical protein CC78DRAFT_580118 [Didymosphaeria enalia]